MPSQSGTVAEDRALTQSEAEFMRWLLRHGNDRAQSFLPQVEKARVVGRCGCGCASINVSIDGISYYGTKLGMETLCEYQWRSPEGALFQVFAFACGDLLAGIDLWSVDGQGTASALPPTSFLQPINHGA